MGYLIDTNVLSELRKKQKADPNVKLWFENLDGRDCFISVLTIGEIHNGIKRLEQKDIESAEHLTKWLNRIFVDFYDRVLPITSDISVTWGEISAMNPLPVVDGLIASTAIIHNLTLVTRNIKDVKQTGAKLLNPFDGFNRQ